VYTSPEGSEANPLSPTESDSQTDDDRLTFSTLVAKVRRHSSSATTDSSTKNKSVREKLSRKKGSLDMDTQVKRGTIRDLLFKNRSSVTKQPEDLSIALPVNPMYRSRSNDDDTSTVRSDSQTPYPDVDDDGRSLRSSESESVKSPPGRSMQVPQRRRSSNSAAKLFGAVPIAAAETNETTESSEQELPAPREISESEMLAPITQRLLGGIAAKDRRVSMIIARGLSDDSDSEYGDDLPGYVPAFSATDDADMCQSSVPGFSAFDSSSQFTATDEPLPRLSETGLPARSRGGRRSGVVMDMDALKALEASADDVA